MIEPVDLYYHDPEASNACYTTSMLVHLSLCVLGQDTDTLLLQFLSLTKSIYKITDPLRTLSLVDKCFDESM